MAHLRRPQPTNGGRPAAFSSTLSHGRNASVRSGSRVTGVFQPRNSRLGSPRFLSARIRELCRQGIGSPTPQLECRPAGAPFVGTGLPSPRLHRLRPMPAYRHFHVFIRDKWPPSTFGTDPVRCPAFGQARNPSPGRRPWAPTTPRPLRLAHGAHPSSGPRVGRRPPSARLPDTRLAASLDTADALPASLPTIVVTLHPLPHRDSALRSAAATSSMAPCFRGKSVTRSSPA